ncbi:ATP-binding protein [Hydrogenophaga sp.]|uniref:AlbA family DNA-binding domain-containing protein n=1 Tax=Hydrogenophaga sp. TaxID=1904254 RepID=UPI0025BFECFC|nr:ATP-binding protein [Hydrogenophaga sp.]MBT9463609.1 ATP-binding protein [Hydrogenophaga sp.]
MTLPRNLANTTEADLLRLIAMQVTEGTYLDLKRELPRGGEAGRHEFLADVSAFANSSGGDLLYGLDEDGEGRASAIVPLDGNADVEARRLQDMLMNGVEPRIPGVQVQAITIAAGFVLAIRVPQSWAGPHRVKTNQHFFIRENGRKRQLDVPEVRGLFLRSENQAKSIRDFRTERLGKLLAGEAPHRLVPGPLLVGHFVPTQAALGVVQVDPVPYIQNRRLPVLGEVIPGSRINVDGALVVRNPNAQGTHGYSLLFRNGYFETVKVITNPDGNGGSLGSIAYEQQFIGLLDALRAEYERLEIGLEMTCMVSILNADNVELGLGRDRAFGLPEHQGRFDRRLLVLPDVLIPGESPSAKGLRQVFDLVWQAAGLERSWNYDEAGEWAPRR